MILVFIDATALVYFYCIIFVVGVVLRSYDVLTFICFFFNFYTHVYHLCANIYLIYGKI